MITRVGLVGVGFFGKLLLKVLRETPGVEVVAVYDRTPGRENEIDLQTARFYTNLQEMFENQPMDAIVIAEIPANHLLPTKLAANKGIHVFCEKPMANTLAECDEMIEVCMKNNVKLMVGFKHRFAKAMAHVKRELPKLGQPLWGMYTYPLWRVDDPGWKFDENGTKGIIVENMVHAFDIMRYFFGDFRTLYAEGDTFVYPNTTLPDSAIMVVRFENGAIGGIGGGCTSDRRITREYLDLHFTQGVAQISGLLDQPDHLRLLMRNEVAPKEFSYEGSDGIREEIKHFIECVQKDKTPLSSGTDGKKALEIALAALDSIRTHQIVTVS
jgi:myo-inositol 2-dehydrogenase/D-chiro-inositol 1-dehydrogenase